MKNSKKVVSLEKFRKEKQGRPGQSMKHGPDNLKDMVPDMKRDVQDLAVKEKVVEQILSAMSLKAIEEGRAGRVPDMWLEAEKRIESLRFLRFMAVRDQQKRRVIFSRLKLAKKSRSLANRWLSTYCAVLEEDLHRVYECLMGYKNKWMQILCTSAHLDHERLMLQLSIETYGESFEMKDSVSSLLNLSAGIMSRVKHALSEHGVPPAEFEDLVSVMDEIKFTIEALEQEIGSSSR